MGAQRGVAEAEPSREGVNIGQQICREVIRAGNWEVNQIQLSIKPFPKGNTSRRMVHSPPPHPRLAFSKHPLTGHKGSREIKQPPPGACHCAGPVQPNLSLHHNAAGAPRTPALGRLLPAMFA